MANNSTILITGASGFIGSFLADKALEKGYDTYAGIRPSSSRKYLSDKRIKFINLNYANKEKLVEQLQELKSKNFYWDYIIHNLGVTKCNDKSLFNEINFIYTKNFVEALEETQMTPKAFVYMSSLSAWGGGNENTLEEIKLSDAAKPNTLYGQSKIDSENFISGIKNFPYIFIRPTGVYGPREKDYFGFIKSVKNGIIPAIGSKPQYLTFIYVKDLATVVFDSIEKNMIGKSYFVGDGKVYTSKEYADIVKQALNKKHCIKLCLPLWLLKSICYTLDTIGGWFKKSPTLNKDKYKILKIRNWKCDTTALQKDLNFSADYDLKRGIKESIEWYKNEGWI